LPINHEQTHDAIYEHTQTLGAATAVWLDESGLGCPQHLPDVRPAAGAASARLGGDGNRPAATGRAACHLQIPVRHAGAARALRARAFRALVVADERVAAGDVRRHRLAEFDCPPVNALAVQWLPRSEQLRAGSIRSAALFIGAIVGGGVMVLVLSRWSWQAPFVIMGAALLVGCLPFAALRAQASLPVQDSATDNTPPAILADWASFFAQPGATQWTWMLLTSFPFIGAVWLFLKLLMLDQGMPLEQVAWTIGIAGGVTGALFSLIGGRLISVLGTARAIVLYLLAALAALVLLTVVVWAKLGAVWLTISALIVAASMGAISALMLGLTMFFTRRQRNASDYGLQSTIFTVARLAVPVAAGVMLDYLGHVGMLTGMSIGVLCALGLALRARHSVGTTAQKVMARED